MKIDIRRTLVLLQERGNEECRVEDIFPLFKYQAPSHLHPCPRLVKPIVGRNVEYCASGSCSVCVASFLDREEDEFRKELGDDFIPCVTEKH